MKLSYKEPTGGFWFSTSDDKFKLGIRGYTQANQKIFLSDAYQINDDYPFSFTVKRARLGFEVQAYRNFSAYTELDAAPITNVTVDSESNIGMVEGWVQAKIWDDNLVFKVGKIKVPFSTEGYRSSRTLDTIERYAAWNALTSLPAFDYQYGAMLSGVALEGGALQWFLVLANGDAKASANYAENNKFKDLYAKVAYDVLKSDTTQFSVAAGFNRDNESSAAKPTRTLRLKDATGAEFNNVAVSGFRNGYTGDIFFRWNKLGVRTELLQVSWEEAGSSLLGGMLQLSYWAMGDENKGLMPVLKVDYAKMTGPLAKAGADSLTTLTGGYVYAFNRNFSHYLNVVGSFPSEAGNGVYTEKASRWAILSQFQLAF